MQNLLAIFILVLAQRGPTTFPAGPPHDPHDLSGVWLLGRGGGTGTVFSTDTPSLTAEGMAKLNANKPGFGPRAVVPAFGNDPIGDANPPGLPRMLFYPRPFQIVQLADKILEVFEWTRVWREVWTDGRKAPEDPDPKWYGTSIGRWEGDTFVVETSGLDPRAWLDQWGYPYSEEARLVERYRRADRDNLELTVTLNDPKFYTKPWTTEKKIFRLQQKGSPDSELLEVIFAPLDENSFNKRIRNPAGGLISK
jgi:hypothetical protein